MKPRGQTIAGNGFDGFDKNVAHKMPKIRKEDEPSLALMEEESLPIPDVPQEIKAPEGVIEKKPIFTPPQSKDGEEGESLEILKLIEDLHAKLLVSNRTKRALEIDLASSQQKIHQLTQENKALSQRDDGLAKDLEKLHEIQSELSYLEEENEDALERISVLQEEIKLLKERSANATLEREQALHQIQALETQIEQNDFLRIKEKLKEKEVFHFSEENRELRARLEEALAKNADLEKKYEAAKKSFNEVKDSLTLLRDACKASYYNSSDSLE